MIPFLHGISGAIRTVAFFSSQKTRKIAIDATIQRNTLCYASILLCKRQHYGRMKALYILIIVPVTACFPEMKEEIIFIVGIQ